MYIYIYIIIYIFNKIYTHIHIGNTTPTNSAPSFSFTSPLRPGGWWSGGRASRFGTEKEKEKKKKMKSGWWVGGRVG